MSRTSITSNGRPPCDIAILEWLANSAPATALQIARALGLPKPTAYAALVRMERAGQVRIESVAQSATPGRQLAQLWALRHEDTRETMVARAIRTQPPLAAVWARVVSPEAEGVAA